MHKVLILDANERSALAATRSLGSKGIHVVVADSRKHTLSGASKYSSEDFVYPSPYSEPNAFLDFLSRETRRRQIRIIFPMTEVTTHLLLLHRDRFSGIEIPFAPFESFDLLTNKWRLFKLAQELQLPMPDTQFIESADQLEEMIDAIEYPVVLKPYRSRILSNGTWKSFGVTYAHSPGELRALVRQKEAFSKNPFLLQTYIQGRGEGVFALYDKGKPVTFFAHRRIREKPPSGGVSVLRESIPVDPSMKDIAHKLLDAANWHGVAMVEFKVSESGTPYLMEVNARFWGSLQLAIDAGVDFPFLLFSTTTGKTLKKHPGYKTGIKTRWLLGDLDHLYTVVLKNGSNSHPGHPSKWRCFCNFLNPSDKSINLEVMSNKDPAPFFEELKQYFLTH